MMIDCPPEKPFRWCPRCGIHNYCDERGGALYCEDCGTKIPQHQPIRNEPRMSQERQGIWRKKDTEMGRGGE